MFDSDVREAEDLLAYGFSTYKIARWYGVTQSYIWCVGNGARKRREHVSWNTAETVRHEQIEIRRLIRMIDGQVRGYKPDTRRIGPREYLQICKKIDAGEKSSLIAREFRRNAGTIREIKSRYLREKRNNEKPSK